MFHTRRRSRAKRVLFLVPVLVVSLAFPLVAAADVDEYGYEASWENTEPPADGSSEAPGGGADGYDPALDTDDACDAYADLGLADACLPPDVYTDPADPYPDGSAVLYGRIHPHGSETTYYFEWQTVGEIGTTSERMIEEVRTRSSP